MTAGRVRGRNARAKRLRLAREPHGRVDLRGLSHRAVPVVAAGQPFRGGRDQGDAQLVHGLDVARREWVVPHEGVHGWRGEDRLLVVPRSDNARQEVVA